MSDWMLNGWVDDKDDGTRAILSRPLCLAIQIGYVYAIEPKSRYGRGNSARVLRLENEHAHCMVYKTDKRKWGSEAVDIGEFNVLYSEFENRQDPLLYERPPELI
jgi:hypothetical protein